MLVGKIFEEVLKVNCCEVGVDEGEDDPVWEADLLHDLVHLHAQVAFLSCWEKEHFLTGVSFQFLLWRESKLKWQLCNAQCAWNVENKYSRVHQFFVTSFRKAGMVNRQILMNTKTEINLTNLLKKDK